MKKLEHDWDSCNSKTELANFTELAREFHDLTDREAHFCSKYSRARAYGEGERPGHTLASLIRPKWASGNMMAITDASGGLLYSSECILHRFREYYHTLYMTQSTDDQAELQIFLDQVSLAWLNTDHREELYLPIYEQGLCNAITELKNNSALAEFYKTYVDILVPRLAEVYEEAYERGILPPSLRQAIVVTLLKPGKSPEPYQSHRPLSITNVDSKILTKVLANRLLKLMPLLVRPDQAGFIPGRSTADNLRTLFAATNQLNTF